MIKQMMQMIKHQVDSLIAFSYFNFTMDTWCCGLSVGNGFHKVTVARKMCDKT